MWPWGHLAVGYLVYATALDRSLRRPPGTLAVLAVAFGTQFPDLVDKPLAWSLGVIPNGRSLAHSLVVATVVLALLWWIAARRDREDLAVAFGVGYVSHLAADAFEPFLAGRWSELAFLGWPLLPAVQYDGTQSILARFADLGSLLVAGDISSMFVVELIVVLVAAVLWSSHGYPGLPTTRTRR